MRYWTILFFLICIHVFAEEKVAEKQKQEVLKEDLLMRHKKLKKELELKYLEVNELMMRGASNLEYQQLAKTIKKLKEELDSLGSGWRENQIQENSPEESAFWDPGEITLSQVIMEYGSMDYLYVIPPEIAKMKMHLFSAIPIPRDSWDEMIGLILAQNGIGVKKVNPFTKQLFHLKHHPSQVHSVVKNKEQLDLLAEGTRVFYVFSPKPEKIKASQGFFERFSDPKQVAIQPVGTKIALVSSKENIKKLLELYDAVWGQEQGKVVHVVNLSKISAEEAEKVLKTFFQESQQRSRPTFYQSAVDELMTMVLPQGLILIGEEENVERARSILTDLEAQLLDPKEMTTVWYVCKHSDPDELAGLLQEVYNSLFLESRKRDNFSTPNNVSQEKDRLSKTVDVPMIEPGRAKTGQAKKHGNFIVDLKSGSILMVIRREEVAGIQSILKKLDTPKKMVEIEVLLVEKRTQDRKQTGINLLKIGSTDNERKSGLSFETDQGSQRKGILDFILSRKRGKIPAFDLTFSLLLAQDNIRINANPSIIATNQTPATISIVEEISINDGAIQLDTANRAAIEKSFTRAQYGTTIVLTPTIHLDSEDEEGLQKGFVNLQTNITFDTTQMSSDGRPPVTRRHIENEVRIADGETIILGGLRRKSSEESFEKIPFLGDLPGIGKLFGTTRLNDSNTEMFIFITPRILKDSIEDLRRKRSQELKRRPGDIPEFLQKMEEAKEKEQKKVFQESIQLLFNQG